MIDALFAIPGLALIVGALVVPALPQNLRSAYMLALIGLSALSVWQMPVGVHMTGTLAGLDLTLVRSHDLTAPFALVFHIAAALNVIYAMHEHNRLTATAGLAYAGAAIAALFAGDFFSLFIYWELTAFTSVLLILTGTSPRKAVVAMRYLLMQVGSGVILLSGTVLLWRTTGSLSIDAVDADTLAGLLILIAIGIKAAFPLLGDWLQDAYPEASPVGTVMLSAFTTKLAIYMLAVCFAGYEALIYIGVIMAITATIFALIENDLRRVLAYSLNGQLGIMVVAIGIGSSLALSGAVMHAFASTIYQGLLFMCMGAVLHRTGTTKADRLGGLAALMPRTAFFAIIGAASIASVPLFSGFATKSLTLGAAVKSGYEWVWVALLFASVGALLHSGLRLGYHAFFAENKKMQAQEAPLNMQIAMGLAALLCVAIGIYPQPFYALLPYEVTYKLWDAGHVLGELQILAFATLAAVLLVRRGIYKNPEDKNVLTPDALLRRALVGLTLTTTRPLLTFWNKGLGKARQMILRLLSLSEEASRQSGLVSGIASTGAAAGVFLAVFALMLLIRQFM